MRVLHLTRGGPHGIYSKIVGGPVVWVLTGPESVLNGLHTIKGEVLRALNPVPISSSSTTVMKCVCRSMKQLQMTGRIDQGEHIEAKVPK